MPVSGRTSRGTERHSPVLNGAKLLAHQPYEPTTAETKTVTSTTAQDADANSLKVTFVPSSTRVLLVLSSYGWSGGVAGDQVHMAWNVREGSSDVFVPQRIARSVERMRHRLSRVVTGLTGGQTYTWKWGLQSSSATIGVNLGCGGAGSSAIGPAEMMVLDLPAGAGDLLGSAQYTPDPASTPTRSSGTFGDLDATNLAVTFTPPGSEGTLLVELEGYCAQRQKWTVREGTTDLTSDGVTVGKQAQQGGGHLRIHNRFFVPYSTGGEKTWKWGWGAVEATPAEMYYGTDYGAAEMRVWAVEVVA